MDDRWDPEITEYGAINITGFRIVDTERRYVREFLDGWKRLDPITSIGAGKESITVCITNIHLFSMLKPNTHKELFRFVSVIAFDLSFCLI